MRVFITRHGETIENKYRQITGHQPGRLSVDGIDQALRLQRHLREYSFQAIFSSDLYRAVVTAQILAAPHECTPIYYFSELREMHFGAYTGKLTTEVDWSKVPPGGETVEALCKRAVRFVENHLLHKFAQGDSVLIVAHHLWINALLSVLTKEEVDINRKQAQTAITMVEMDDQFQVKHISVIEM